MAQPRLCGRGFVGKASWVRLRGRRVQGPPAPEAQPRLCGGRVQGPPAPVAKPRLHGRGFVGKALWVRLRWRRLQGLSVDVTRVFLLTGDMSKASTLSLVSLRPLVRYHHHQGFPAPTATCPRLLYTLQYRPKSLGTIVIIKVSLHLQRRPRLPRTCNVCVQGFSAPCSVVISPLGLLPLSSRPS